ncbi:MAG: glycine cleavage system protein H [Euryarchaeota archaeon RBG_19FT_COMBO_56_21]|nr:MAG: glycine cleavage system protein H [Euryarchaeota archaeon RBG_19FT_COMBO_56_21]
MSVVLPDLKYTKDHEWVKAEGKLAKIGITDHAQAELTEIVFVELPAVGKDLKVGEILGNVESVKTISEVFAPVSGAVKEANDKLVDSPELLNKDPYGQGWIAVVEMNNPGELAALMSADEYKRLVGE